MVFQERRTNTVILLKATAGSPQISYAKSKAAILRSKKYFLEIFLADLAIFRTLSFFVICGPNFFAYLRLLLIRKYIISLIFNVRVGLKWANLKLY
jgi:hypothetical protein